MKLNGVSPNALAQRGNNVLVSLGAANAVAVIRKRAVVARFRRRLVSHRCRPGHAAVYVINGKGEGTRPNPYFRPQRKGDYDYIATLEYGSIRSLDPNAAGPPNQQGAIG